MLKKIISLILIYSLIGFPAIAKENIGNEINQKEYPESEAVLPKKTGNDNFVIEGSVEKSVDMTLDKCI